MLRVNNFNMKQKENMEYLFFHIPPDRIKVSECEQGTVNFSDNTTTFKKKSTTTYLAATKFKYNSALLNY